MISLPDSTLRHVPKLGSRATLVQFSTGFCAPCRAARSVLAIIAGEPGIEHVDINVSAYPDQAEIFHLTTTPTTLIVDSSGVVREVVVGVPKLAEVRHLVEQLA